MTQPIDSDADADARICAYLREHGIPFARFDHPPVYTCEAAGKLVPAEARGIQTKNLFVRDKRGRRHWLVVTSCEKPVDLKRLARSLGADSMTLGSPERLMNHLGVTPGSVTLLAIAHPGAKEVELIIDRDVWNGEPLRCHPMVNSATLVLTKEDAARFIATTGHRPQVVEVPAFDAPREAEH